MNTPRANALSGAEWLKNSFSIWRGLSRDTDTRDHPAPFPVSLAARLIDCYATNREGLLLDPFAGSGSSLLAGLRAGMEAVGFDINPVYRGVFERRLSLFETNGPRWRYEVHDARHITDILHPGSVEICITSPPYWDILNRKRTADGKTAKSYSASGRDLGNLKDYGEFLDALSQVAGQVNQVLRPRRYFILNVMDIRKGALFYPLHQDASNAVLRSGNLTLEDIIVWDRQTDYNAMRPLGYPYKFIVNKVHEYLLIFRKGERDGQKAKSRGRRTIRNRNILGRASSQDRNSCRTTGSVSC